MLAVLFLLALGLSAGSIALEYVTLDASFVWLWLPSVLLAVGTAAIGIARYGSRGTYEPSEKAVAAALETNGGALARITSVSRTETHIKEATLCVVTLVVAPDRDDEDDDADEADETGDAEVEEAGAVRAAESEAGSDADADVDAEDDEEAEEEDEDEDDGEDAEEDDSGAYKTRTRLFVDRGETTAFLVGTVKLVARPDLDRPDAWIVRRPDREWRKRIKAEGDSVPEDAPLWKDDGQPVPFRPEPVLGRGRRRRPLRLLAYVVALLLGLAAPTGVFRDQLVHGANGVLFSKADTNDFTRNWRQQDVVGLMTDFIGHDRIAQVVFSMEGVKIAAPAQKDALALRLYEYDNGAITKDEQPLNVPPEQVGPALFDAGDVDYSRVPKIVADAMKATGMEAPTEILVGVRRTSTADDPSGPVQFQVQLTDEGFQGMYIADLNGALVAMSGGHPGSPADLAGQSLTG